MIAYGITTFGNGAIIRLRAKLTQDAHDALDATWGKEIVISRTLKGYTMVEGVLSFDSSSAFYQSFRLAILDNKVAQAEAERASFMAIMPGDAAVSPEDADLL
jgi:hypothetical protein